MYSRSLGGVVALFLLAGLVTLFVVNSRAEPIAHAAELHMGDGPPGAVLQRTFQVTNSSRGAAIADVRVSCACLAAATEATVVSPGSAFELDVHLRIPSSHGALLAAEIVHQATVLFREGDALLFNVHATVSSPPVLSPAGSIITLAPGENVFRSETTLIIPEWLLQAEVRHEFTPGLAITFGNPERVGSYARVSVFAEGELAGGEADFEVSFFYAGLAPVTWTLHTERPWAIRVVPNPIFLVEPRRTIDVWARVSGPAGKMDVTVLPEGACSARIEEGFLHIHDVAEGARSFSIEISSGTASSSIPIHVLSSAP